LSAAADSKDAPLGKRHEKLALNALPLLGRHGRSAVTSASCNAFVALAIWTSIIDLGN